MARRAFQVFRSSVLRLGRLSILQCGRVVEPGGTSDLHRCSNAFFPAFCRGDVLQILEDRKCLCSESLDSPRTQIEAVSHHAQDDVSCLVERHVHAGIHRHKILSTQAHHVSHDDGQRWCQDRAPHLNSVGLRKGLVERDALQLLPVQCAQVVRSDEALLLGAPREPR